MRLRSMLVLAVILGGSLLVAFPDGGALAASPPPAATRLALATTPLLDHKGHVIPGKYLVVATLTAADGKPLSNQSITFFEQQEFLGTMRQVGLGMATTDATGTGISEIVSLSVVAVSGAILYALCCGSGAEGIESKSRWISARIFGGSMSPAITSVALFG